MDDTQTQQNQPVIIPDEIRTYLNRLLEEARITNIDDDTRESMIQTLFMQLDDYIIDQVVQYMPADKLEGFTELVKTNPSKEVMEAYIREHVPNAQDVFTVAFADFREAYLKAAQQAKEDMQKENI